MTTLNFKWGLTWEDEGYESGSERLNIPAPQKSTANIHFHEWEFVFQPHHTAYHSWTTSSTVIQKTQKPQSCMLPFSIQQFGWGEPCENWYIRQQPTPLQSRTFFTSTVPYKLSLHMYTKHRWLFPRCYCRRRGFSYSSPRWWHLLRRYSPT